MLSIFLLVCLFLHLLPSSSLQCPQSNPPFCPIPPRSHYSTENLHLFPFLVSSTISLYVHLVSLLHLLFLLLHLHFPAPRSPISPGNGHFPPGQFPTHFPPGQFPP